MNYIPLITVVIPLYNGSKYISRSLKSVLNQSFTDFELIIVDDGSIDDGISIVLSFNDERLRVISQENMGVSAARNKGIVEGRGKYFAFLDADDEWDIGFLDAVINLTKLYPQAGIYGTGYRMVYSKEPDVEVTAHEVIYQQSTLLVTDYFYRASSGSLINASGILIPKQIFHELGAFKVGEHHGEDREMWARIALRYPIGYDPRILFSFFQTSNSEKKRFQKPPNNDPTAKMLQMVLNNTHGLLFNEKNIRKHIKLIYLNYCFWLISNSSRNATLIFTKDIHAEIWCPLLDKVIKYSFFWPVLKLIVWIDSATKSRLMLKLYGGKRIIHGIFYKLSSKY